MQFDEWTTDEPRITDGEVLRTLRTIIEDESALIVEHRIYKGSQAPRRFVFDDPDAFEKYLRDETSPGDSFYLWRFDECCRDDNAVSFGKVPDSQGRTPKGGAY